ncbi:MAG: hypothetical protein WAS27_00415 [Candidatus Saccharimonadales bacterium]
MTPVNAMTPPSADMSDTLRRELFEAMPTAYDQRSVIDSQERYTTDAERSVVSMNETDVQEAEGAVSDLQVAQAQYAATVRDLGGRLEYLRNEASDAA